MKTKVTILEIHVSWFNPFPIFHSFKYQIEGDTKIYQMTYDIGRDWFFDYDNNLPREFLQKFKDIIVLPFIKKDGSWEEKIKEIKGTVIEL